MYKYRLFSRVKKCVKLSGVSIIEVCHMTGFTVSNCPLGFRPARLADEASVLDSVLDKQENLERTVRVEPMTTKTGS